MGARTRALAAASGGPSKDGPSKEGPSLDADAFRIGTQVWAWMAEAGLFLRFQSSPIIPDEYIDNQPPPDVVTLLNRVEKDTRRGLSFAIGSRASEADLATTSAWNLDSTLADLVESFAGGPIAWRATGKWLVGRTEKDELIAVWEIKDGGALEFVAMVEHDDGFWGVHRTLILLLKIDDGPAAAAMRLAIVKAPAQSALVARVIGMVTTTAGRITTVYEPRESDDTLLIGPACIPVVEAIAVVALHGKDITWSALSERDPVVARAGGKVVAVIMPCVPSVEVNLAQRGLA